MEASAGEYSVDEDDQLQPEDTLIDRGIDDVLDEGYSPPEQPYGRGSFGSTPESLEQLLAEEEPDPAMHYMTRPTRTSSNALTKPSVRPNFRSMMRLDAREQVDLSRRIRGLAKT